LSELAYKTNGAAGNLCHATVTLVLRWALEVPRLRQDRRASRVELVKIRYVDEPGLVRRAGVQAHRRRSWMLERGDLALR
jgi:hypothetical protein